MRQVVELVILMALALLIYDLTTSSFLAFFFFIGTIGLYDFVRKLWHPKKEK